ncbi:transposase [Streptomyces hundungensis]|uniref:transposase n=1 Tax=Streptomyces hundungensis TaxID=1077946 RepID=UPI003F54CA46
MCCRSSRECPCSGDRSQPRSPTVLLPAVRAGDVRPYATGEKSPYADTASATTNAAATHHQKLPNHQTKDRCSTRGFDAGKKVNGRKRFIVTDTLGPLLAVHVVAANIQDRDEAKHPLLWSRLDRPGVQKIWADQGFAGRLVDWARATLGRELEILWPGCVNGTGASRGCGTTAATPGAWSTSPATLGGSR